MILMKKDIQPIKRGYINKTELEKTITIIKNYKFSAPKIFVIVMLLKRSFKFSFYNHLLLRQ
jgi:hypothetical protein